MNNKKIKTINKMYRLAKAVREAYRLAVIE